MPKIYTRTGDKGDTALFQGGRVPKDDPRVMAYGTVDELNSFLGLAMSLLGDCLPEIRSLLTGIQQDMFNIGAELASPTARKAVPTVTPASVTALEQSMDKLEADLEPLRQFILPGGTPAAAAVHCARSVCRRAEREIVRLSREHPVNPDILAYCNRLSDLLFVLARWLNHKSGVAEPKWEHGPVHRS